MVWLSSGKQKWYCDQCKVVQVFIEKFYPKRWECKQCKNEKDLGRR